MDGKEKEAGGTQEGQESLFEGHAAPESTGGSDSDGMTLKGSSKPEESIGELETPAVEGEGGDESGKEELTDGKLEEALAKEKEAGPPEPDKGAVTEGSLSDEARSFVTDLTGGAGKTEAPAALTEEDRGNMTADEISRYEQNVRMTNMENGLLSRDVEMRTATIVRQIEDHSKEFAAKHGVEINPVEVIKHMRARAILDPGVAIRDMAFDGMLEKAKTSGVNDALKSVGKVEDPAKSMPKQGRRVQAKGGDYGSPAEALRGGIRVLERMRSG